MKKFLYVIAWAPPAEDPAERALVFRHHFLQAEERDEAFAVGQNWAAETGLLPLPGPGNDQVIELDGGNS